MNSILGLRKPWLSTETLCKIHVFLSIAFVGMLLFSKYGTSMIMLFYVGLVLVIFRDKYVTEGWRSIFQKLEYLNPAQLGLLLLFGITVLGFVNSEDTNYWLSRIRIRLPLLAMPVIFLFLPTEIRRWNNFILRCILGICLGYCLAILINSFTESNLIRAQLERGMPIMTPMHDHIRLAQFLAMIALVSIWQGIQSRNKMILFSGLLLTFFLHFIAVRSGLLIVYVGLLTIYIMKWKEMKPYFRILGLSLILLCPVVAVNLVPNLKSKWNYTKWDIGQFKVGNSNDYSDGGRLSSILVGKDIFMKNLLFGVGPGDMEKNVEVEYKTLYPQVKLVKQPHNQYVHTAAASGLIGLILFLFAIGISLWFAIRRKAIFLLLVVIASCCAFMVEASLETARATAMIAYFWSLWSKE